MNRRAFLHKTTVALAAASLPVGVQSAPAKRPLKKGLNLRMIKIEGSVTDQFKAARDAGFDGIELNRPDATPLEDLVKPKEAGGLPIAGMICSTHWGKPLTENDPAIREQGMRGLKLALQDAAEL